MNRMTVEEWPDKIDEILDGVKSIMKAKNQDYTAGSGDPFANFRGAESFGMDPLAGLCLRMDDKFQRVKAYFQNGELAVEGEGLEDAFKDIIGYSVIALGMLDELKGNSKGSFDHDVSMPIDYTITINLPKGGSGGVEREADSPESKPSWKDAPEWANWLAQDQDGEWYWYEEKPHQSGCQWTSDTGDCEPAGDAYSYKPHWAETLEARPNGK